jgi:acid phosphatase class B
VQSSRVLRTDAAYTGTTAAILAEQAPIHWVSVAKLK